MIPLMKNAFINEFETKQALADFILKAPRLSMDSACREFERSFAAHQGHKDAILFNSGGSANLVLLQSLKNMGRINSGDRIGFSALTWSTNVMPIIQIGCEPIAIDCTPETLNVMSTNLLKTLTTTDIKAFFATNVLGFAGDLDVIRDICSERGILFLEDNCEGLGTELPAGKAGNFSLAATNSFFVAHHMSTIEGGMICTDDEELSEMLRIVRANGWDRNLTSAQQFKWRKKYDVRSEFDAKYTFYDLGFNMRPTEITGFLGLQQLKHLDYNISVREKNYLRLDEMVRTNPDLIGISHDHLSRISNFSFPVLCRRPELRERYLNQFSGAGIEIRPMIAGNIQKQPFYLKYVKNIVELPGTDFIHHNGFYCGNYPELTETDLETLSSCLRQY